MHYGIWKLVMQNLKNQRSSSTSSQPKDQSRSSAQSSRSERSVFGVKIAPMPDASTEAAPEPITENVGRAGDRHYVPDAAHRAYKLKRTRYLRIVWFFAGLTMRSVWWEVIV